MPPAAAEPTEGNPMNETDLTVARAAFAAAIAEAKTAEAAFAALHVFAQSLVPARLFTVSLMDTAAAVSRRAYTSDPVAYPVSGTKPIVQDGWYEMVHGKRQIYVQNDLANDLEHFTDFDLINALGCQAAMNLPVILAGEVTGSVNILDVRNSYPESTVDLVRRELPVPAMLALALAGRLAG